MILLNFSHPITPDQQAQIEALAGRAVERVLTLPTQFDNARPFAEQTQALTTAIDLSPAEWQTAPLLVVPPAYAPVAMTLLAELHGRMGYFPAIVRIRPLAGSTPPQFEVAEIVNLQAARDAARERRRE